ncbi:hypothetical protein AXG93_1217s1390 [Marchantia polymorpha subsp. ruderalis]|uniref:Glycoside hydrolase family 3 C-terminal domain-containing protein n=1 Tax=Marchantia polymorpha subsp. ruderalis TaxID=1480154 RepID=A0A176VT55_MARPO|nr:hypothetical protein AXG93_1217s1390 [Marchantia polymorpha subsp. ruderalis]
MPSLPLDLHMSIIAQDFHSILVTAVENPAASSTRGRTFSKFGHRHSRHRLVVERRTFGRHVMSLMLIMEGRPDDGMVSFRSCTHITPLQGLSTYEIDIVIFEPGCSSIDCSSDEKIEDALLSAANKADVVILVMGLAQDLERETFDRNSFKFPGKQELLVSSVANVSNGPVVLVLICGGPLDISWAKNDSRIQSILWMCYPGQAGGLALAQIIFGDRNPVGRLPVTWSPESLTDWPMTFSFKNSFASTHLQQDDLYSGRKLTDQRNIPEAPLDGRTHFLLVLDVCNRRIIEAS